MTSDPAQVTGERADLAADFRQVRADLRRALREQTICICILNVWMAVIIVAALR